MESFAVLKSKFWDSLPDFARRTLLVLAATVVVLAVVIFTTQNGSQNTVSITDGLNFGGTSAGASSGYASSAGSSTNGSAGSSFGAGNPAVAAKVVVQVVGAVTKPGVYELPVGSRVLDAVFAAGGFANNADQSSINLARPVNDGEQILVLQLGSANQTVGGVGKTALVNLNLADATTLDSLPGIGPALAQRIIDYRNANGGFRSVSDLGKVAGIGVSLLAKLKDLVSL